MRMYDLIQKKRDGIEELTREEIAFIVKGYTDGSIPDYQMSAFLMAGFLRGFSDEETLNLTMSMAESGQMLNLDDIPGIPIDKHSTGGVGDKTTLIVAPVAASFGLPVAKMSGRGLGHTGGTIDKLESIPGFRTDLTMSEFFSQVKTTGMAVMSQTMDLAPADKKIYALRDVTATIESRALIASSIMSKKLAAGAKGIVLDVKYGSGAFMKNVDDARELAETMIRIGNGAGRRTCAVLSSMEQPLGNNIGNALEVQEAIDVLRGEGAEDLTSVCRVLAGQMLYIGEKASSREEGEEMAEQAMKDGSALSMFRRFVEAQGGADIVSDPSLLPKAAYQVPLVSRQSGYISRLDALTAGKTEVFLGAGREVLTDPVDHAAGVVLMKKYGDVVKEGDVLAVLHFNDKSKEADALSMLLSAYSFSDTRPAHLPLIDAVL